MDRSEEKRKNLRIFLYVRVDKILKFEFKIKKHKSDYWRRKRKTLGSSSM